MADSSLLTVIRIWAAMAWADGELADAEASALRRLIGAADLTDAERAEATRWLDAKDDLDETGLASLSADARMGIYRAACRVAAVDRRVTDSERSLLARLRDALGLGADQAREIEAAVPGITAS